MLPEAWLHPHGVGRVSNDRPKKTGAVLSAGSLVCPLARRAVVCWGLASLLRTWRQFDATRQGHASRLRGTSGRCLLLVRARMRASEVKLWAAYRFPVCPARFGALPPRNARSVPVLLLTAGSREISRGRRLALVTAQTTKSGKVAACLFLLLGCGLFRGLLRGLLRLSDGRLFRGFLGRLLATEDVFPILTVCLARTRTNNRTRHVLNNSSTGES